MYLPFPVRKLQHRADEVFSIFFPFSAERTVNSFLGKSLHLPSLPAPSYPCLHRVLLPSTVRGTENLRSITTRNLPTTPSKPKLQLLLTPGRRRREHPTLSPPLNTLLPLPPTRLDLLRTNLVEASVEVSFPSLLVSLSLSTFSLKQSLISIHLNVSRVGTCLLCLLSRCRSSSMEDRCFRSSMRCRNGLHPRCSSHGCP